jgi:hypothetical protein
MAFIAQRANEVSPGSFGDIRTEQPTVRKTNAPIGSLSLAHAAQVVGAGVAAGALGYAVGHNVH